MSFFMQKISSFILILLLTVLPSVVHADRMFTTGLEGQTLTAGEEFTSAGFNVYGHVDTTIFRSGASSINIDTTLTAAFSWFGNVFRANGAELAYARCYVYITSLPATNPFDACSFYDSAGANRRATVSITSGGVAQLLTDNNTQVGSDSSSISTGQWYCVEISATGNSGSDHLEGIIQADTCTGASAFATTETTTIGNFDAVYVGTPNASTAFEANWDDIAINDSNSTKGSTQTGYPGEGKIVALRPNAETSIIPDGCNNGPYASWCSGASYLEVDEIDPDTLSSFIDLDNVGSLAYYNITDTTGLIDSYDTISLVDMNVQIKEQSSAVTSYVFGITSNGIAASSTAQDAGNTTWRTNPVGTTNLRNRLATTTDPNTNSAWTTAALDSAQIGVGSLDADNIDVSTLWLNVEYVDGTAPAAGGSGDVTKPRAVLRGRVDLRGKAVIR